VRILASGSWLPSRFLDRPPLWKFLPQFLVLRIVFVIPAKTLERRNDVLFIHFHCAGDHTRGLFEAEASVVVSPTHARKDVKRAFFVFHL
jgi:hypothetical protein